MTAKTPQPTTQKSAKKLGYFASEPVFVRLHPEETPPPAEAPAWPKFLWAGGLILALACVRWLAPVQMSAIWKSIVSCFSH